MIAVLGRADVSVASARPHLSAAVADIDVARLAEVDSPLIAIAWVVRGLRGRRVDVPDAMNRSDRCECRADLSRERERSGLRWIARS